MSVFVCFQNDLRNKCAASTINDYHTGGAQPSAYEQQVSLGDH